VIDDPSRTPPDLIERVREAARHDVPIGATQRFVRGEGRFIADVAIPGVLHGAFVRSPYAHADIRSIDVEPATGLPGVVAVLTASDLGPLAEPLPALFVEPGFEGARTHRALASDVVRYAGEPVALVVARTKAIAADALDLVSVDYEALRPVASLEAGLADHAPLVHADLGTNRFGHGHFSRGDAPAVIAAAPRRLALRLRMDRGAAVPLEGRGVLARPEPDGMLTIWSSTQRPVRLRNHLAAILGLPSERVRVITGDIGGGFGPKGMYTYPEEVTIPWAALRLGMPIRWIEDRYEHMVATHQSREQLHEVEVGFDADGRVLALRDHFWNDVGASAPYGASVPAYTAFSIPGPYRVPAYDVSWELVYTNRTPTSPYRGSGGPYATFVMERTLDRIASDVGIDRAEVRRRNLLAPDELPWETGLPFQDGRALVHDAGDYPATLQKALDAIEWASPVEQDRRQGGASRRGIGIACYAEATGPRAPEGVRLTLEEDGTILARTGTSSQGQGHESLIAHVVSAVMGVGEEAVHVMDGDSSAFETGLGTYGSKVAVIVGTAGFRAATRLREQVIAAAADRLLCSPADLDLEGGHVTRRDGEDTGLDLAQLAAAAEAEGEPFDTSEVFSPERAAMAMGAHAARVEVDELGQVRILRYVAVTDSGLRVSPRVVDGQIVGAVAQGIGGMLLEQLAYDEEANPLSRTLMDYLLPTALDVPAIESLHVEHPTALNELGIKGAGEAGIFAVNAVLASAIEDALGLADVAPIDHAPLLLPEREALVQQSQERRDGRHAGGGQA
jgi:CO/xanthine dehydrogenase Mo-binding subunit